MVKFPLLVCVGLSFLSRVLAMWFKKDQPRTRLDEARVLEIARTAAAGQPHSELLTIVTLGEHAQKPTWFVSTATVGSSLVVTVDDGSGEVVEMKRYGIR